MVWAEAESEWKSDPGSGGASARACRAGASVGCSKSQCSWVLSHDVSLVFRHWNTVDVDFSEELPDLQVHWFFCFGERNLNACQCC